MGLPLIPLITAGASLAGNIANAISTSKTNQRQQDYNEKMYNRQRADALADWNMQNAYNSPSQQMQRFKEAGLNPNLIYGQMTNSPIVRSTDAKSPDFVAPKIGDLGNILNKYYETRQQDLTIKNQEKALELADANIEKVKADTRYTEANTNVRGLQYDTERSLQPNILEAGYQKGQLLKAQVNTEMYNALIKKENLEQMRKANPLLLDKLDAEIKNILNTNYWRNLTEPMKIRVLRTVERLNNQNANTGVSNQMLLEKELETLERFGVNKNFLGDLIKIIATKH